MYGNYDAKDTTILVDGVYITGLGEDMFSCEKEEDFFAPSVGAQGDVVASETNNPLGTFSIFVQPTSPSKAYLLSLKDRKEPFPVWAINKKLGERVGGTQARMLSMPEIARGAEAEDMEFVFQLFDYTVEATA